MDEKKLQRLDDALETARRRMQSEIDDLNRRNNACKAAKEALAGIRRSWRDWLDPGKYGPAWFLVRDYELGFPRLYPISKPLPNVRRCEPFFARELVDDLRNAERGLVQPYARPGEAPKPVPLGGLSEAKTRDCPSCGSEALVVGCHQQTEDSPEGDAWMLRLYVLCPDCPCLYDLGLAADGYRCLHGTPDPR